jgi:hypothetical protein
MPASNRLARARRPVGPAAPIPRAAARTRPVTAPPRWPDDGTPAADGGRWSVRRAALAILAASVALWAPIALLALWLLAGAGPPP